MAVGRRKRQGSTKPSPAPQRPTSKNIDHTTFITIPPTFPACASAAMSLDWDKLIKLQRDYTGKPKFALQEATRRLKKKPHDPYLLAWRAELALQLGDLNGDEAQAILKPLFNRQPPISDLTLLSYLYQVQVEIVARSNPKAHRHHTAGDQILTAWKNAAKILTSRKARTDLWSELFVVSMREKCWSDVHEVSEDIISPKKRWMIGSMSPTCINNNGKLRLETNANLPCTRL